MSPLSQVQMSPFSVAGDFELAEGVTTLSKRELDRVGVIEAVTAKRMRQAEAAIELGVSVRQVKRLVQIDGSPHDWFEGLAAACTLLVFIDDATGQLLALRFVPTETTRAYMELLHDYLTDRGRPVSLYSDRHSIFRVNDLTHSTTFRPLQMRKPSKYCPGSVDHYRPATPCSIDLKNLETTSSLIASNG